MPHSGKVSISSFLVFPRQVETWNENRHGNGNHLGVVGTWITDFPLLEVGKLLVAANDYVLPSLQDRFKPVIPSRTVCMVNRSTIQEISIAVVPVVLGFVGLFYLPSHDFFKQGFPAPSTPDFFPSLVGVFLVMVGLTLLAQIRKSREIQIATYEPMTTGPVYQTIAIFVLYWLLLNPIGFIASSAIAVLALCKVFRERLRLTTLIFAIALPCVVHVVFKRFANVYLPPLPWP